MAKCINKIINQDVSSSGIRNATDVESFNNRNKGDIKFADNFIDTLERATKKLQRTNCTDVVLDYFSNALPVSGNQLRKGYEWVSDNVNLQQGMQKFGGALDKVSSKVGFSSDGITTSFCVIVNNTFRHLIFYIDAGVKAAIVLFKKIDALKSRLEKALVDFNSEVRDCIVSVIVDAKVAINKTVNNITDFTSLIELMDTCPCVKQIIQDMFNCHSDDNGDVLINSSDIVNCVMMKFSLDPDAILSKVNSFIDNSILDNINNGFNKLDTFIKNTMELLMTPLRDLMRMYCMLLNEKINVTNIVRTMGNADCLLLYTKERDKLGNEYYGMSVIDMINTFKLWANCFDVTCKSFSDDLKNKIKSLNEDLRLDDKYWRDVMLLDIYQSCIAIKVQSQQPRATMVRELYSRYQDKGKNVFINLLDVYKRVGKIENSLDLSDKNVTPIADAIHFKDGPDNEDLQVQQGVDDFYSGVENNIISILRNIGSSIDDNIYYERFLQLVEWEGRFKKTDSHIRLIENIDNKSKQSISSSIVVRDINTSFDTSNTEHDISAFDLANNQYVQDFKEPIYKLNNDYNNSIINNFLGFEKPIQRLGESLENYYSRWYNEVLYGN